MATASESRTATVRPPGIKYPWSDWQNGKWWTITKGEDFQCSVRAMRDQLHVRARATETKVKTHTDKVKTIEFTFQCDETDQQFADRVKAGRAAS
jgi:hypothetical protein